ncbi:MAG: hypothetical protein AAF432_08770, partial [Planctomycetota bacterium]
GCWLLAVGCWLLAVGCWLLAVGCWLYSLLSTLSFLLVLPPHVRVTPFHRGRHGQCPHQSTRAQARLRAGVHEESAPVERQTTC